MKIFILFLLSATISLAQKQMAITIDDLPYAYSAKLNQAERDSILIKLADSLQNRNVTATGFVIGSGVDNSTARLLVYFAGKGHDLANHTYSHPSANNISAKKYMEEVKRCDSAISGLPHFERYFRYSYLQRGNSLDRRDSIFWLIKEFKLTVAPVTIDNDDYLYNKYYVDSIASDNHDAADSIAEEYLDYMLAIANSADSLSHAICGRSIKHILLTHANLLNSRYYGRLLDKLRADGWQFITLKEALKDPVYAEEDIYIGKWGISWLKRIKQ